ncbi:helix-turn-helix protein [Chitinophaga dinghuensis]|uniref:Helix-turn-helix protein n=1 Tax=Chitinophaga dinghuensis TaxID=1539050 RepID=A0A327WCJ7_9BACT|nr:helix-turn-helix transcriptional regulator [Chitinophaga dinghuensis]RAJ87868.1 helix-turn-helix protein [Chitinophaga dinghuensis]
MKRIVFVVEKTGTGYSAFAKNFEKYPIGTTGKNMRDLRKNILDATHLFQDAHHLKHAKEDDIIISLDLHQFFEYYKIINATALAERIGMSQSLLSQYANGIKSPSEKQTNKILQGIRELGKEFTQLELV